MNVINSWTLLTLLISGVSTFAAPTSGAIKGTTPAACATFAKAVSQGTPSQKLSRFIDVQWKYLMVTFPEWATYSGYPGQDDRWTDRSLAAIETRKKIVDCQMAALKKISRSGLKGEDTVNYDLQLRDLDEEIKGNEFDGDYLVLNHLGGIQTSVADMMARMPTTTKKNYEDRIARLEKVPQVAEQVEVLLREGAKRKVTPVKMHLEAVPRQFDVLLTEKIEDSPLYKPFADMALTLSAEEKLALQNRALEVIRTKTYPALKKVRDYVVSEYIPQARTSIAWKDLPKGEAWYAYNARNSTTTELTPEQLHQLGLKEVARITTEMEKVKNEVGFKGDLKAFNKFLLEDKRFFYSSKEELLMAYRDLAKRIDPELPRLFKTLPRLPYGIEEMPAYKAKEAPAAYYEGGSLENGTPGVFVANVTDLKSRPKWSMEALTMHEAVPGHHFQISIAQEVKELPDFRRNGGHTAYTEGWGLYAEGLGKELGFYKDPYSYYGRLSYEMWRACRLVLDTGLHMKGWTREQAIQYFLDHNAMTERDAKVEVDRYITWPGQALAYKVGELKFRELREMAQTKLGDKFDVRQFHDEVLKHGSLPMNVLEKTVKDWVTAQSAKKQKSSHL